MNNFNIFILKFVISVPFTYIGTKKIEFTQNGKAEKIVRLPKTFTSLRDKSTNILEMQMHSHLKN